MNKMEQVAKNASKQLFLGFSTSMLNRIANPALL